MTSLFKRLRHFFYGNGYAERLRPLDDATARMQQAGDDLQKAVAKAAQRDDPLQALVHNLQNARHRRWMREEEQRR